MKLHLLHGPAIASSRVKLVSLKDKFDNNNVVVFDKESDVQTMLGSLMTPSLLPEEQLIVLENPSEDFVPTTTHYPLPTTLLLWFDHEVGEKKPIMEWVKKNNGQAFYFPEAREISVFPFLDHLANGEKKAFIELDKLKKGGFDIHYLITMTFYLLRNLVVTPKNAHQFVKDKLARQRKNFDLEKIIKFYKHILEIDFKIKSGLLEKDQAEFMLVNKFL